MAALDWFSPAVVAPAPARPLRRRPAPVAVPAPRRRAAGRRLTGGIVWISVLAVLLAGIVAVNVAVLRVNVGLTKLDKQQQLLQAQNDALASQVSSAGASLKIEATARRLGLVPAPGTDTTYIDLGSHAAKP
jgi:cell division protein FtsB